MGVKVFQEGGFVAVYVKVVGKVVERDFHKDQTY